MRERRSGLIINLSSLGGLVSVPFHGLYCASKFAVEGLTEALRLEVAPFGVKVSLVEPGDYKTGFTSVRKICGAARNCSPYSDIFEKSLTAMEKSEKSAPPPDDVARLIVKIVETPRPKLRYCVAPGAQKLVPFAEKFFPRAVLDSIITSQYGNI